MATSSQPFRAWRLLVLDRDPIDPKYLLATVAMPGDVWPAFLDEAGRYRDWRETTRRVRGQLGHDVRLHPVSDALAWHLEETHHEY